MPVGVVKIDAVRVVLPAVNFDAGVFKGLLDSLVVSRSEAQGHMIDFAAPMDVFIIFDFKEGDALTATFQEALPVAFVLDLHAEKVDIEFSRPRQIFDVENHVIDAGYFE
jgi:hypothetical protein